jgi:adenosylcobinamide-GDP ribazoletransferase
MPFGMDNPALWRDTIVALRFFSRLPLPPLPGETDPHGLPDFTRLIRVVPLAGLVLGGLAGAVLILASLLWPPVVAALLCVGAAILMTGAFHEDGLADTADSFGGMTIERRLDIMKDSRIGTFGAAALIIGLGLRVAAISALVASVGAGRTALVLAASGALSRAAALGVQVRLPPARVEGAAYATGKPREDDWFGALLLAAAIFLITIPAGGIVGMIFGLVVAGSVVVLAIRFAESHVGGQTGDVTGATQQVIEIAVLLTILAVATS